MILFIILNELESYENFFDVVCMLFDYNFFFLLQCLRSKTGALLLILCSNFNVESSLNRRLSND